MDPHSRRAQYNQRPPKAGPELQNLRHGYSMEMKTLSVLDAFRKTAGEGAESEGVGVGSGSLASMLAVNTRRTTASEYYSSSTSGLGVARKDKVGYGGKEGKGKGKEKEKEKERDLGRMKSPVLEDRPIATNSRVRRDEKYKRDMYLAFVDNALIQKAQGKPDNYDDLVRQFLPTSSQNRDTYAYPNKSPATSSSTTPFVHSQQLRAYLGALQHVVSKLDRTHEALVDAVVNMPWAVRDSALAQAYVGFAGVLVSARPEYLGKVLEAAVQGLTYQYARKALDAVGSEPSITRRTVYARVHGLLSHLRDAMPTLPAPLFPLLARAFPHRRERLGEHVAYVHNLLRIAEYMPELWERILGLVVDRAIQIDVEIQVEIEELEASEEAEEIFQLDVLDTVIGQEPDGVDSDEDEDEDEDEDDGISDLSSDVGSVDEDGNKEKEDEPTNVKHIQDMVSKLDNILEIVFKHLDRLRTNAISSPNSRSPSPTLASVSPTGNATVPKHASSENPQLQSQQSLTETHFNALLAIFKRTILRTFRSRYTQFLLFWYSSLDDTFRDCFLGALVSTALLEPSQPVVTRAAAASYLASYVSRAAFVGREETQSVVRVLCDFLAAHLRTYEELAQTSGTLVQTQQQSTEHAVFYAVTQAMFLIFCFRWRDLKEDCEEPDEFGYITTASLTHKTWYPPVTVMKRVVNSPLNPLKVCSSNVVQQFARVAQRVDFVYCFSILEANRRADYTADAQRSVGARHAAAMAANSFDAELTTFFPFDPFRLPRSSVFIENIYREWTSVALDDSEDEDDSEEDGEEDEESVEEDGDEDERIGKSADPLPVRTDEGLRMRGPASLIDDEMELGASFGGMSISPARPPELVV